MKKNHESPEEAEIANRRRWRIPSFLVRNYRFGYERECTDLMFSGSEQKGAREVGAPKRRQKEFDPVVIVNSNDPLWELP